MPTMKIVGVLFWLSRAARAQGGNSSSEAN
jgi:hypothetical protein